MVVAPNPPPPAAAEPEALQRNLSRTESSRTFLLPLTERESGGVAEDPELLELLRGVSSSTGGADRFGSEENGSSVEDAAVTEPPA